MTLSRLQRLQAAARGLGVYSSSFWHRKCVEPVKRKHGGPYSEWQIHRFEIKGGISLRDAMIYDMMNQRNPLLDLIKDAA